MPELQMDVAVANRFISSLSKSLQALCHGCMDFDSGIEIVGYINVNIDSGSKVDYVLNEKVLKSNTNSMTFVSNSFLARKEQPKHTRDGACSPISDTAQQHSVMSQYQSRLRGSFHGSHPRGATPFSHVHRGSQKRAWAAMDRDWRLSPKKHRDGRFSYPPPHDPVPTAVSTHPTTSQNPADPNFKWPQTTTHSSDKNNTGNQIHVNIKKEVSDTDDEQTVSQKGQDQDTNDNVDEALRAANASIKYDPDASTSAGDDENHPPDGAGNEEEADFKDTFLEPSISGNSEDNMQSRNQADNNNQSSQFDITQFPGKSSHSAGLDITEESATPQLSAENVTQGSEVPVEYEEPGEEDTYPQSVYSDAGEGSSDAGQFEVIEIDDEDEDVQAMFGASRDLQDNTFDNLKHVGSHESEVRRRFSQTWAHDAPASSFHSLDFTIQIPSKDDCPFDPVTQRFICPVCKNSYLTYTSVCGHIKLKHQGRYETYCDICGKGFQRKIHLQGHMAVHGQPMNFECLVCGAKYAHKTSLRAHERLMHGIIQ